MDNNWTTDRFRSGAVLSFSGGLQDAYTYNVRGKVFANAQTGNVVLMSQSFMMREWEQCIRYGFPLLSFVLGVIISEQISYYFRNSQRIHWKQMILIIEILLLGLVGFLPEESNILANCIVSLSCAMQVQGFRSVHGLGYASTMCIGNLRSGTESLSKYFREKKRSDLTTALHYFAIILAFAIGAGAGGVLSLRFGLRTIWLCDLLLLLDIILIGSRRQSVGKG